MKVNRTFRQPFWSEFPCDFTPENGAHHTVGVANRQRRFDFFSAFERRCGKIKERLVVERILQPMILGDLAVATNVVTDFRLIQNRGEI